MKRRSFLHAGVFAGADTAGAHLTGGASLYSALIDDAFGATITNPFPLPRGIRQTGILLGNGGAAYGPFDGLRIFDIEDVEAYVRPEEAEHFARIEVDVTKLGGLPFDFFTVAFPANIPVTTKFVIRSARVAERTAGVDMDMTALEKELSKQATVQQELRRDLDRSVMADFGAEPQVLPASDGKSVLGWSPDGRLVNREPEGEGATRAEEFANVAQAAAGWNLAFVNRLAAQNAAIPAAINTITLKGWDGESDGRGGQWTDDPAKGQGDSFFSAGDTARAWLRVFDIGLDRLADAAKRAVFTPRRQKFVMLSDAQPASAAGTALLRARLARIKAQHADADFVTMHGDIVNRGVPYTDPVVNGDVPLAQQYLFSHFMDDMRGFPLNSQRFIAHTGNHDRSYQGQNEAVEGRRFDEFLKHFERQFFYLKFGNIVFICLGNITHHTVQPIPEFALEWVQNIVKANQDNIIILATHEPLPDTTNKTELGTYEPNLYPYSSLIAMLQKPASRVDIWPAGHVGGDYRPGQEVGWIEKYGTFHFQATGNMGVEYATAANTASYVVMELDHGSPIARFTRYDADTGLPIDTYNYTMRHEALLSNAITYDGRYQFDPRYDVQLFPSKRYSNVPRVQSGGKWIPTKGITWMETLGLLDVSADDMPAGTGVGIRLDLPGATTNDFSNAPAYNGYGFGGGLSIERVGTGETDYTARFALLLNDGRGPAEANAKRTFTSRATGSTLTVWSSGGAENNVYFTLGSIEIDGGNPGLLPATSARLKAANVTSGTAGVATRTDSTGTRVHMAFENPNGVVGSITTNLSSTAYLTSSDRRLKQNFLPIADALERLAALDVYRGEFKTQPGVDVDYFIADEVMAVVPEAVSGEPDAEVAIGDHLCLEDIGELYSVLSVPGDPQRDSTRIEIEAGVQEANVWHDDPRRANDLPDGVRWRKTGQAYRLFRSGVIAEGVEAPDQWRQTGTKPVYQGVDQSKLVPLLWAAVRQLAKRVEMLEAAIK